MIESTKHWSNKYCDFCGHSKKVTGGQKEVLFTFSMIYYNICKSCENLKIDTEEYYEYSKYDFDLCHIKSRLTDITGRK